MANKQQNSNRTDKIIPAPFARKPSRDARRTIRTGNAPPAPKKRRGKFRPNWNIISYALLVLLPVLVTALYYAFLASDQYMVETRFAVRSATPKLGGGLLGSLGLGLGGASENDTYIILEYIHSREILKNIDKALDLRKRYRRPAHDYYAKLPDPIILDDYLAYWKSMTQVSLDHTSHIITVKTFAFTPQDARDIAQAVLNESERMINELSEHARQDAVVYAKSEVQKAEKRVRDIRKRFLKFRNATQQIDPAKQAQVQVMLVGKLEEQLAELRTKLSESRGYLSDAAPTIIFLKNRIKAVKKQIAEEKRKLGDRQKTSKTTHDSGADSNSMSKTLSEYEALMVEREFAEKFYLSALKGLEEAHLLANRQQRYLATFERPYLPDGALYPKRIRNTLFVFLALSLIWGLGKLMLQSISDRM